MHHSMTTKEKLPSSLKFNKLPMDNSLEFELDNSNEWMAELLHELALKTLSPDSDEITGPHPESYINLKLQLTRRHNGTYRDHVVVNGEMEVRYHSYCVRCLEPMELTFDHNFAACYIPQDLEESPEYAEATHLFCDDQELELYFHEKGMINLKELVHEHLFLMIDEFPLHAEDCKGLCQQCGANLNHINCGH